MYETLKSSNTQNQNLQTPKSSNANLSLNERWGPPATWRWQMKPQKKMLLQVLLLLVVFVGWSYQMSLAHATRHVPLSLPNSEKIKLPTMPLLFEVEPAIAIVLAATPKLSSSYQLSSLQNQGEFHEQIIESVTFCFF